MEAGQAWGSPSLWVARAGELGGDWRSPTVNCVNVGIRVERDLCFRGGGGASEGHSARPAHWLSGRVVPLLVHQVAENLPRP